MASADLTTDWVPTGLEELPNTIIPATFTNATPLN